MLGDSRPGRVHAVSVIARWRLQYPDTDDPDDPDREDASGLTLILFQRLGGEWSLVQDASL